MHFYVFLLLTLKVLNNLRRRGVKNSNIYMHEANNNRLAVPEAGNKLHESSSSRIKSTRSQTGRENSRKTFNLHRFM